MMEKIKFPVRAVEEIKDAFMGWAVVDANYQYIADDLYEWQARLIEEAINMSSHMERIVTFIEAHAVAGDDPEAQAILDLIRPSPKDTAQMSFLKEAQASVDLDKAPDAARTVWTNKPRKD
jgi:hypothetical protein